jgi:TetR/AcrR family transcriptional repressor of bet genes
MSRPTANKQPTAINENRRKVLIEGTIQSLAEFGIAGTTISTICQASKSSRGLISHYFESKEALLAAALKVLYEQVSTALHAKIKEHHSSPTQQLKMVPKVLFSKSIYTVRNRNAFLSLWHETRFNTLVRQTNRELYRGYLTRMNNLFEEAAIENARHIDPHQAAIGFVGLTDGLWLGMAIHDKLISRKQAVDTCLRFIDKELGLSVNK